MPLEGGNYGMRADRTTAHAKTGEFTHPLIITGIVPAGQAEKLGLRVGDRILAIQLAPDAHGTKNKVHEICAVASESNLLIQVVDKKTQIMIMMGAACRIFVALLPRCATHECSGEIVISDDCTDHCMVCMQCGVVAASRMPVVCEDAISDVQRQEICLQRLSHSPLVNEASNMHLDTFPHFPNVTVHQDRSGIMLRNAAARMHAEEHGTGVKKQKKQEQEAQTDIRIEQICLLVELPLFVRARASLNFKNIGISHKYSLSDTEKIDYLSRAVIACIFDAANFHQQPRTIWHLISCTCDARDMTQNDVAAVFKRLNLDNTEIDPLFLMDTVFKFCTKLKCTINAAKAVLITLKFYKSSTAQEQVALAIVYATAIVSALTIDEIELSTVAEFLSVEKGAIRKLLKYNPFSHALGGQGGVGM